LQHHAADAHRFDQLARLSGAGRVERAVLRVSALVQLLVMDENMLLALCLLCRIA
jgi:hypothetical protein